MKNLLDKLRRLSQCPEGSVQEKLRKEADESVSGSGILADPGAGFGSREFDVVGGQHLVYMSKVILRMVSTSLGDNFRQ